MKHTKRLFVFAALAFLCLSCQKESLELDETTGETPGDLTVLGKKLDIPFTVENMQQAYDNLKKNSTAIKVHPLAARGEEVQIAASHHYYRFLPKDSLQYETLVNDTILMVSDVPFEYEQAVAGDYYQDPQLQETDFTYYYATVSANHPLPDGITHTRLADLYFPPEDETENTEDSDKTALQFKDLGTAFFDDLETEALKITGNLDEQELNSMMFTDPDKKGTAITYAQARQRNYTLSDLQIDYSQNPFQQRPRWEPHGRITVEEDVLTNENRTVGVMGAEVRVRKWGFLVIRKAITDRDGNFTTRRTRTKRVKYAVYFQNIHQGFTVKAGTVFWDARYRSTRTHKRKGWFEHFTNGTRRHLYALVHNATFDYYDRIVEEYGIEKPRGGIRLSAKFNLDESSQNRPHLPLVSEIRITRKSRGVYRGSDGIYATTIHELTHAGHRKLDTHIFDFLTTGNKERQLMIESWAEGVETIVTNDRYISLDVAYGSSHPDDNNGRWNYRRQEETVIYMDEYTPIVEDLIDNLNQNIAPGISGVQPIDRVSGYNLSQIQNALNDSHNIDEWEQKLRWYYDNPTEGNLTELFDYIRDVKENID